MILCLVLGLRAILRRDVPTHRAWMIRAYALGLGAGTQVVTIGLGQALFGTSTVVTDAVTAVGWAINLTLAELVIRMPRAPSAPTRPCPPSTFAAPPQGGPSMITVDAPHQAVRRQPRRRPRHLQMLTRSRDRVPGPQRGRQIHDDASPGGVDPTHERRSQRVLGCDFADLPNPGRDVGVLLDASAQHVGRTGREVLT